ncbi:hypothetical protein [Lysobacter silvisoli]|uniref:hypothetical protein n=1 Tax=Lysobacter silvisoli TaxID=2293254 RepID=UPI0011C083D7|nr:hypothetical protein [Lysobacter silvisoli]
MKAVVVSTPMPDSVCVSSFDHSDPRVFRITLDGRRVEVVADNDEDCRILGRYAIITTSAAKHVFLAYFAGSGSPLPGTAPDYRKGIHILVDNEIIPSTGQIAEISTRTGMLYRAIRIQHGDSKEIELKYSWPFWRELVGRTFSGPFEFETNDFCTVIAEMAKTYGNPANSSAS